MVIWCTQNKCRDGGLKKKKSVKKRENSHSFKITRDMSAVSLLQSRENNLSVIQNDE